MVSIIIPVLDERDWLPRCLAAIEGEVVTVGAEVVVVDGGSRDGTPGLARRHSGVRVATGPTGRGRQMNQGARLARGSLLVFLPADTLLPPGALRRLDAIDRAGRPAAGGFRQRFDRPTPLLRAVSALHTLRSRLTRVFYGDQVPFVRRELFERVGGYREDGPLEDVDLGARLRRVTRARLQPLTVTTSARRFERAGALRATAIAAVVLGCWVMLRRVPFSRTFFTPVR